MGVRCTFFLMMLLVGGSGAVGVSPVQKVIELIDGMKGKVEADLKAESSAMEEYTAFCDDELKDKGYAIKTSTRQILDFKASIEDHKAAIAERDAEIVAIGSEMSQKDKDLANATEIRKGERDTFETTEKDLMETVDTLTRAVVELKKSMSFMQVKGTHHRIPLTTRAVSALEAVVEAAQVSGGDRRILQGFLQQKVSSGDDDGLSLDQQQPQAKTVAYESQSGGIVMTVEDMKGKAEDALTTARRGETKAAQGYSMMKQSLENELNILAEKKSTATSSKEASAEALGKAEGELVETQKGKAADEAAVAELQSQCSTTTVGWEARQKEAASEIAALDKAKEILTSGVKVFVQVGVQNGAKVHHTGDDSDDASDSSSDRLRATLNNKLKSLSHQYHSYALMEMANAALQDPFVKIKGLIEDMIAKLIEEAQQEATQKAFCDEEEGKSKKSQAEKTMTLDKLTTRIDQASSAKAELTVDIKELESEVAEIDKSQAEATKIRTEERGDYEKSSKDFKDSAEATERAIVVLKDYYEGSLLQVQQRTSKTKQPEFGGAKSDAGHTIIEVLSMAAEDFTKTYAEIEAEEAEAVKGYESLTQDNKVAKAAKQAEVKAKQSEVKSLTVALANHGTDKDSVSKELDAVLAYLDKLKPQCAQKVISYNFKMRKRNEEIAGLKEALSILEGAPTVFIQRHS